MRLMVGTIVIENGVRKYDAFLQLPFFYFRLTLQRSMAGARITIREPPQFTMSTAVRDEENPMMCVSPKRDIFQCYNRTEGPRRIKACLKQVVGVAFTGLSSGDASKELDIINSLVNGSRKCAFDPQKTQAYHERKIVFAVSQVVSKLRVLIADKVQRYFEALSSSLVNPNIKLAHDNASNNCQQFCANILNFRTFGSFFATTPACRIHVPKEPLYLVSFVCPPGSYDAPRRIRPGSKGQAPNGLTEEYLLRFRIYGHHDDSDQIDTLREYWNDWGAFGGTLYKNQDLFPWDCTEAYRKGEEGSIIKCNNCFITSHIWSHPFDAWSIVQLHSFRDQSLYPPPPRSGNKTLTESEWMRNRLDILSALRALTLVTVAMAKTASFRATCRWNRERRALTPDTASTLDRLKLSGIHRAQPFSHSFELPKYHDCTLAPWALSSRKVQIKEYEKLRDFRAEELDEIPQRIPLSSRQIPRDVRKNERRNEFRMLDRDTDETSGSETERRRSGSRDPEYDEELPFEEGGGLLPSGFGPDPPGYGNYDIEPWGGLIPDSFGADPDSHYHEAGTEACDYDKDTGWIDSPDDTDYCRQGSSTSREDHHRESMPVAGLPEADVPLNTIFAQPVDPSSLLFDERLDQIREEISNNDNSGWDWGGGSAWGDAWGGGDSSYDNSSSWY
jgi:hypothetical protein